MNKVALKTIGFEEQNEATDEWIPQEAPAEPGNEQRMTDIHYIGGIHRFKRIDQQQASMTEELAMDGDGNRYHQRVQFAVRLKSDRDLAKRYERRPLVLHVWTVDGDYYKIGTPAYPAYLMPAKTKSMSTVETALTVDYETTTPIM